MSKTHPIFFVSNTDRKDRFLIETRIWRKKSGFLYVEKRAVKQLGKQHLHKMVATHESLTGIKGLASMLDIVTPEISPEGYVKFKFVEGMSAERLLLRDILLENETGVYSTINALSSIIDRLPSAVLNPSDSSQYVEVFGHSFNQSQECTKLGIVDLNLDNIIIDALGQWHLYDYEWVFDFAVPKQLLRTRFLWYFFSRHREVLKYHSQHIRCVRFGKEVYVPTFVYEKYQKHFEHIKDLYVAEKQFQYYVTNKEGRTLSLMTDDLYKEDGTKLLLGIDESIKRAADSQTKKIQAELESERKSRVAVEEKLNRITSHKLYRVARKLARAKRKVLPQNKD